MQMPARLAAENVRLRLDLMVAPGLHLIEEKDVSNRDERSIINIDEASEVVPKAVVIDDGPDAFNDQGALSNKEGELQDKEVRFEGKDGDLHGRLMKMKNAVKTSS